MNWRILKMGYGRMGKFVHQLLILGIYTVGSFVALPAFAAESLFDASYSGPATVTYGSVPVCGADGSSSITVKDGEIRYGFGAFPLKIAVGPDGTFSDEVRKGNRGGAQTLFVKGRISNSVLDADFVVNDVSGHVCSYHWSLKKG
jgi:hypothetical protein